MAAGAISKANADDPKKSSLVRCARTDRGVHAAGNIISLKMIIEDPDIVKKINENLSPQIRVWGIERTNGSFSAYQLCDSRVYEYLIPTSCFLPPHPDSFLGRELVRLAEEASNLAGYEERQKEVANFWKETEENYIRPHLATLDPELAAAVRKKLYDTESETIDLQSEVEKAVLTQADEGSKDQVSGEHRAANGTPNAGTNDNQSAAASEIHSPEDRSKVGIPPSDPGMEFSSKLDPTAERTQQPVRRAQSSALELALRTLKNVIISAKRAYRIHPSRLARVQSVLDQYIGTQNFHNYTIAKGPRDPSAKRVIKSFAVAPDPILINNTEWLSLKVHGQSFMMHQIRKMVTMAAMIVRSGCPKERMKESYGLEKLTVPKAPSLGLLLERPVFDTYNTKIRDKDVEGRGEIGFEAYREEMEEFKQKEIYERIFREEERDDTFVLPYFPLHLSSHFPEGEQGILMSGVIGSIPSSLRWTVSERRICSIYPRWAYRPLGKRHSKAQKKMAGNSWIEILKKKEAVLRNKGDLGWDTEGKFRRSMTDCNSSLLMGLVLEEFSPASGGTSHT